MSADLRNGIKSIAQNNTFKKYKPFSTEGGFHLNDLQAAYGFGFRFNSGAIMLKYDIAFPTEFKDVNKPITFFSIGTDF